MRLTSSVSSVVVNLAPITAFETPGAVTVDTSPNPELLADCAKEIMPELRRRYPAQADGRQQ